MEDTFPYKDPHPHELHTEAVAQLALPRLHLVLASRQPQERESIVLQNRTRWQRRMWSRELFTPCDKGQRGVPRKNTSPGLSICPRIQAPQRKAMSLSIPAHKLRNGVCIWLRKKYYGPPCKIEAHGYRCTHRIIILLTFLRTRESAPTSSRAPCAHISAYMCFLSLMLLTASGCYP